MRPEALEEAQDGCGGLRGISLAVERALSGEPVLGDQAAFHSQQAAEKAFKAFLAAHDHPFAKTHNLERLVRLCQGIDPAVVGFMEAAYTLNPYVTQFRYPGGPLEPALEEARGRRPLARLSSSFVNDSFPGHLVMVTVNVELGEQSSGWRQTFAAPRTTRRRFMSAALQRDLEDAFTAS